MAGYCLSAESWSSEWQNYAI